MGFAPFRQRLRRARRGGLRSPLAEDLTDETLEHWFYPPPAIAAKERRSQPDWAAVHRELRRAGVRLQLLWEEHRAAFPEGYGYSRFCELYRASASCGATNAKAGPGASSRTGAQASSSSGSSPTKNSPR